MKQSYFPDMGQKNNMDELGEDHFTDLREIESLYHGGIKTPTAPHKILHLEISSILSPHQPPVLHSAISLTTILPPAESHIKIGTIGSATVNLLDKHLLVSTLALYSSSKVCRLRVRLTFINMDLKNQNSHRHGLKNQ